MKNHKIISEIFHHAVDEKRDVKNPSPNTLARKKTYETVEELEKLLNTEEKKLLNQILEQWMDSEVASNEESFVLSFRLGAKLMDEILEKDSSLS